MGTGGAADLVVSWPGGAQTYTLTARASDTLADLATDRRSIEVTWGTSGQPTDWQEWMPTPALIRSGTGEAGVPVSVLRVYSSGALTGWLELSDSLPVEVEVGTWSVAWLGHVCDLDAGHVPSSPVRAVKWRVRVSAPTEWGAQLVSVVDRGVLSVVYAPFETGLTDAVLRRHAPWTSAYLTQGVPSWVGVIGATLEDLERRLDRALPDGKYADDTAGAQFERAHALLAQIAICDELAGRNIDRSALRTQLAEDFKAEFEAAVQHRDWLDADGDNVVSDGETGRTAGVPARSHMTDSAVIDLDDVTTPDVYTRRRVTDDR
jgi:hypothetical protein